MIPVFNRDSSNPSRLPSADSPTKKRNRRKTATEPRKPGARPGHPGHHKVLLEPKTTLFLLPDPMDVASRLSSRLFVPRSPIGGCTRVNVSRVARHASPRCHRIKEAAMDLA